MDRLLATIVAGIEIYDLGRPLFSGVPQSPQHPEFQLLLPRRHGDRLRPDDSSGANDLLIMGSHVGTHIDALCHISHRGRLYGGIEASSVQGVRGFSRLGIETMTPIIGRGLLLDVATALGVECCPPDYEVTPEDLETALALTRTVPSPGDVLLVRTGWGCHFDDRAVFEGAETGTTGPGEDAARWLADHRPRAVGSETIAFEHFPGDDAKSLLPAHRLLLVERGIHIVELLDLDRLAADRLYEFTFLLSPLKIVGATGSPARPIALVSEAGAQRGPEARPDGRG